MIVGASAAYETKVFTRTFLHIPYVAQFINLFLLDKICDYRLILF